MAEGIDGTFDFVGNAIRVSNAPPRTIELLSALQGALRKAEQNKPAAEVISEIEQTSPELASAIQKKVSSTGAHILAGLLVTLLAGCSMSTTLDLNVLLDQIHVYATGAEPYAADSVQPRSEETHRTSRQQRRHIERQAKKQQRQNEQRHSRKPKR